MPSGPPREVAYEDVVKGYEISPDRYVLLSPGDLRAIEPERTHSIDIEEFVDLEEIDPLYFDRSYYVAPHRSAGSEKPYGLLLDAMRRSGKVAIARFVLRTKPYLAAIRPVDEALVLHTLFYADEVRAASAIDNLPVGVDASGREVDMAVKLIEILGAAWDPTGHRDEYRERVLELIREKAEAAGALVEAPARETAQVESRLPELLEALRASVEAAREASKPAAPPGGEKAKSRRRTG